MEQAELEGRAIESNDVTAQGEEIMRRAADGGFGLVISLEWIHGEAMQKPAPDHPDTDWVIMNQQREGANIASVVFGEHEGSYLAGALAAQVTTDTSIPGINADPVIGVIGAVKAPGIDKFISGYIECAKAINPDITVKVAYAESYGDPTKGEQMAKSMFDEGADIVDHVAGGTGIGIIKAAKGADKSTLMRMLQGMEQPDAGSVILHGAPARLAGPAGAPGSAVSVRIGDTRGFACKPRLRQTRSLAATALHRLPKGAS